VETGHQSDFPIRTITSAPLPVREKFHELANLFRMRAEGLLDRHAVDQYLADAAEYERLLAKYAGRKLAGARTLEVGFGARPNRLFVMASLDADVVGVDLEKPLLRARPREIAGLYRNYGLERTLKSVVRLLLFDWREHCLLARALGKPFQISERRLLIGDAVTLPIAQGSLDLIYSEDVFEHIPTPQLRNMLARMRTWLQPQGLALIRPNIFTGIMGGHLAEWFAGTLRKPNLGRRSEPWEHLRKRRFAPNGYVNKLSRADYREIFRTSFEILEERVKTPDLGREYLTPPIAAELSHYPDEELFSNHVMFVLKPLPLA
jgi:hypothetical protein